MEEGRGEDGRTGGICTTGKTLLSSSFDPREACKIFWKLKIGNRNIKKKGRKIVSQTKDRQS